MTKKRNVLKFCRKKPEAKNTGGEDQKSKKVYTGNPPSDAVALGVLCPFQLWTVYFTNLSNGWANLKICAGIETTGQANYWLSYNHFMDRFADNRYYRAIKDEHPTWLNTIVTMVVEYLSNLEGDDPRLQDNRLGCNFYDGLTRWYRVGDRAPDEQSDALIVGVEHGMLWPLIYVDGEFLEYNSGLLIEPDYWAYVVLPIFTDD